MVGVEFDRAYASECGRRNGERQWVLNWRKSMASTVGSKGTTGKAGLIARQVDRVVVRILAREVTQLAVPQCPCVPRPLGKRRGRIELVGGV
jgi:hypothetical protein